MSAAYVQISARIPREYAEALERRAKVSDRTLSAELRRACRSYLAEIQAAHEYPLDASTEGGEG